MKKTILTAITFICALWSINAQQHIDNMQLKCLYEYDYTHYTTANSQKRVDTMMLEVGNNSCKFYSYHNYLVDSIRRNSDRGTWMLYKATPNKYTLYINYPQGKTTVVDDVIGILNSFEYVENFEIPKWTIHAETQKILSHPCKKATCRYRGRDYVAWYALDIPISRGPYKFAGLPGLILKIADTENLYGFECIGMEKSANPIYKIPKKDVKTMPTSREKCIDMQKKYCENPNAAYENLLNETGVLNKEELMKNSMFKGTKIKYNPIELE